MTSGLLTVQKRNIFPLLLSNLIPFLITVGLSRFGREYIIHSSTIPPESAPECTKDGKVTKKSDVWLYGKLLGDLWNGEGNRDILELIKTCLFQEPEQRPDFEQIAKKFEDKK